MWFDLGFRYTFYWTSLIVLKVHEVHRVLSGVVACIACSMSESSVIWELQVLIQVWRSSFLSKGWWPAFCKSVGAGYDDGDRTCKPFIFLNQMLDTQRGRGQHLAWDHQISRGRVRAAVISRKRSCDEKKFTEWRGGDLHSLSAQCLSELSQDQATFSQSQRKARWLSPRVKPRPGDFLTELNQGQATLSQS
jgi:hypothetical protein